MGSSRASSRSIANRHGGHELAFSIRSESRNGNSARGFVNVRASGRPLRCRNAMPCASSIALVHEWFTPRSWVGPKQVVAGAGTAASTPSCCALVDGRAAGAESWLAGRRIQLPSCRRCPWGRSHVQQ